MYLYKANKNNIYTKIIILLLIPAFLSQDIAFAKGHNMLMPESKVVEITRLLPPDIRDLWERYKKEPAGLSPEEIACFIKFLKEYPNPVPAAMDVFDGILSVSPVRKSPEVNSHRFRKDLREALEIELRQEGYNEGEVLGIINNGLSWIKDGKIFFREDDRLYETTARVLNTVLRKKKEEQLNALQVKAVLEYHEKIHAVMSDDRNVKRNMKGALSGAGIKLRRCFEHQYGVYSDDSEFIEELVASYWTEKMLVNSLELLNDNGMIVTIDKINEGIATVIEDFTGNIISSINIGELQYGNILMQLNEARKAKKKEPSSQDSTEAKLRQMNGAEIIQLAERYKTCDQDTMVRKMAEEVRMTEERFMEFLRMSGLLDKVKAVYYTAHPLSAQGTKAQDEDRKKTRLCVGTRITIRGIKDQREGVILKIKDGRAFVRFGNDEGSISFPMDFLKGRTVILAEGERSATAGPLGDSTGSQEDEGSFQRAVVVRMPADRVQGSAAESGDARQGVQVAEQEGHEAVIASGSEAILPEDSEDRFVADAPRDDGIQTKEQPAEEVDTATGKEIIRQLICEGQFRNKDFCPKSFRMDAQPIIQRGETVGFLYFGKFKLGKGHYLATISGKRIEPTAEYFFDFKFNTEWRQWICYVYKVIAGGGIAHIPVTAFTGKIKEDKIVGLYQLRKHEMDITLGKKFSGDELILRMLEQNKFIDKNFQPEPFDIEAKLVKHGGEYERRKLYFGIARLDGVTYRAEFENGDLKQDVKYRISFLFSEEWGQWICFVNEIMQDGKIADKPITAFTAIIENGKTTGLCQLKDYALPGGKESASVAEFLKELFGVSNDAEILDYIKDRGISLGEIYELAKEYFRKDVTKGEIVVFLNSLYAASERIIKAREGVLKQSLTTKDVRIKIIAYLNRTIDENEVKGILGKLISFEEMLIECPYLAAQYVIRLKTEDLRYDKINISRNWVYKRYLSFGQMLIQAFPELDLSTRYFGRKPDIWKRLPQSSREKFKDQAVHARTTPDIAAGLAEGEPVASGDRAGRPEAPDIKEIWRKVLAYDTMIEEEKTSWQRKMELWDERNYWRERIWDIFKDRNRNRKKLEWRETADEMEINFKELQKMCYDYLLEKYRGNLEEIGKDAADNFEKMKLQANIEGRIRINRLVLKWYLTRALAKIEKGEKLDIDERYAIIREFLKGNYQADPTFPVFAYTIKINTASAPYSYYVPFFHTQKGGRLLDLRMVEEVEHTFGKDAEVAVESVFDADNYGWIFRVRGEGRQEKEKTAEIKTLYFILNNKKDKMDLIDPVQQSVVDAVKSESNAFGRNYIPKCPQSGRLDARHGRRLIREMMLNNKFTDKNLVLYPFIMDASINYMDGKPAGGMLNFVLVKVAGYAAQVKSILLNYQSEYCIKFRFSDALNRWICLAYEVREEGKTAEKPAIGFTGIEKEGKTRLYQVDEKGKIKFVETTPPSSFGIGREGTGRVDIEIDTDAGKKQIRYMLLEDKFKDEKYRPQAFRIKGQPQNGDIFFCIIKEIDYTAQLAGKELGPYTYRISFYFSKVIKQWIGLACEVSEDGSISDVPVTAFTSQEIAGKVILRNFHKHLKEDDLERWLAESEELGKKGLEGNLEKIRRWEENLRELCEETKRRYRDACAEDKGKWDLDVEEIIEYWIEEKKYDTAKIAKLTGFSEEDVLSHIRTYFAFVDDCLIEYRWLKDVYKRLYKESAGKDGVQWEIIARAEGIPIKVLMKIMFIYSAFINGGDREGMAEFLGLAKGSLIIYLSSLQLTFTADTIKYAHDKLEEMSLLVKQAQEMIKEGKVSEIELKLQLCAIREIKDEIVEYAKRYPYLHIYLLIAENKYADLEKLYGRKIDITREQVIKDLKALPSLETLKAKNLPMRSIWTIILAYREMIGESTVWKQKQLLKDERNYWAELLWRKIGEEWISGVGVLWKEAADYIGTDDLTLKREIIMYFMERGRGDLARMVEAAGGKFTLSTMKLELSQAGLFDEKILIGALEKIEKGSDLDREERQAIIQEFLRGGHQKDETFPGFSYIVKTTGTGITAYIKFFHKIEGGNEINIRIVHGVLAVFGLNTLVRVRSVYDKADGWVFKVNKIDPADGKDLPDSPVLFYIKNPNENNLAIKIVEEANIHPTVEQIERRIEEEFNRGKIQEENAHRAIFRICLNYGIDRKDPLRSVIAKIFFTYKFYEILKEIREKIDKRTEGVKDKDEIRKIRQEELAPLRMASFKVEQRALLKMLESYYGSYAALYAENKDKIREKLGFEVDYDKDICAKKDTTDILAWLKGETSILPAGLYINIGINGAYNLLRRDEYYLNLTCIGEGKYWMSFEQDAAGQNKYAIIWKSEEEAGKEGAEFVEKYQIVEDSVVLAQKWGGVDTEKSPIHLTRRESIHELIRKFLLEDGDIPPGFEAVVRGTGSLDAGGLLSLCSFVDFTLTISTYLSEFRGETLWVTFEKDTKGNKFAVLWRNKEASEDKNNPYGYLRKYYLKKDGEVLHNIVNGKGTGKSPIIYTWKDKHKLIVEGIKIRPEKIANGETVELLVSYLTHPDSNIVNNTDSALKEWANTEAVVTETYITIFGMMMSEEELCSGSHVEFLIQCLNAAICTDKIVDAVCIGLKMLENEEKFVLLWQALEPEDVTPKGIRRNRVLLEAISESEFTEEGLLEKVKKFENYPDEDVRNIADAIREDLLKPPVLITVNEGEFWWSKIEGKTLIRKILEVDWEKEVVVFFCLKEGEVSVPFGELEHVLLRMMPAAKPEVRGSGEKPKKPARAEKKKEEKLKKEPKAGHPASVIPLKVTKLPEVVAKNGNVLIDSTALPKGEVEAGKWNRYLLDCIQNDPLSPLAIQAASVLGLLKDETKIVDILRRMDPMDWAPEAQNRNNMLLLVIEKIGIANNAVIQRLNRFLAYGRYPLAQRVIKSLTEKKKGPGHSPPSSPSPQSAIATAGMYTKEQHDKTNEKIRKDVEEGKFKKLKTSNLKPQNKSETPNPKIEIDAEKRLQEILDGLDEETLQAFNDVSVFLLEPDNPDYPYCLRTENIDGRLEYQVAHAGSYEGQRRSIYMTRQAFMELPADIVRRILSREARLAGEKYKARTEGDENRLNVVGGYDAEVERILRDINSSLQSYFNAAADVLSDIVPIRTRLKRLRKALERLLKQTCYFSFLRGQSEKVMPMKKITPITIIKTIWSAALWILPKNPPMTPAIIKACTRVKAVLLTASNRLTVQKSFSDIDRKYFISSEWKSQGNNLAIATAGMYTKEQHDKTNEKIRKDVEQNKFQVVNLCLPGRQAESETDAGKRMQEVLGGLDEKTLQAFNDVSVFLLEPDNPDYPYYLRTEIIDGRLEYQVAHAGSYEGQRRSIYMTRQAFMELPTGLVRKIFLRETRLADKRYIERQEGIKLECACYDSEAGEIMNSSIYEDITRRVGELYPYWDMRSEEELQNAILAEEKGFRWSGLIRAMRKDGKIDERDFNLIAAMGEIVEDTAKDQSREIKALLTKTLSEDYLNNYSSLFNEIQQRLVQLGYVRQAGEAVKLLLAIRDNLVIDEETEEIRLKEMSSYYFITALEDLLGYTKEEIFNEVIVDYFLKRLKEFIGKGQGKEGILQLAARYFRDDLPKELREVVEKKLRSKKDGTVTLYERFRLYKEGLRLVKSTMGQAENRDKMDLTDETDFSVIRNFLIDNIVAGSGELRLGDEEYALNDMLRCMCGIIAGKTGIRFTDDLPDRIKENGRVLTMRLHKKSDNLFCPDKPKDDNLIEVNRDALLFLERLGIDKKIITFLVVTGIFYEQLFCRYFGDIVSEEDMEDVRVELYKGLFRLCGLNMVYVRQILELLGNMRDLFDEIPPDISSMTERILSMRLVYVGSPDVIMEYAVRSTLTLLYNGGIEQNTAYVFKAVEYFTKNRVHGWITEKWHPYEPVKIYLKKGMVWQLVKNGQAVGKIDDILVLKRGRWKGTDKVGYGLRRIMSKDKFRDMQEKDVAELIGRVIMRGECCIERTLTGTKVYFMYRDGDDFYKVKIDGEGFVKDISCLSDNYTYFAREKGYSIKDSNKIALISNGIIRLAVPVRLEDREERINQILKDNRDIRPVEVFFDNEKNDIYIVDVQSGDVVILSKNNKCRDFVQNADLRFFFANPCFERISEKVLENYIEDEKMYTAENAADPEFKERAGRLINKYGARMTLSIVSLFNEFKTKGVLKGGIPDSVLEEYIYLGLMAGEDIHPGHPYSPERFYRAEGQTIVIRDKYEKKAGMIKDYVVLCHGGDDGNILSGLRRIFKRGNWDCTDTETMLELLGRTLKNHIDIDTLRFKKIYIFSEGGYFYKLSIVNGYVAGFSRVPAHKAVLYNRKLCSLKQAKHVYEVLNENAFVDIPRDAGEKEEIRCVLNGKGKDGRALKREVFFEKETRNIHVVDWDNHRCVVIGIDVCYREFKKCRHKHYYKGREVRSEFLDITKDVLITGGNTGTAFIQGESLEREDPRIGAAA